MTKILSKLKINRAACFAAAIFAISSLVYSNAIKNPFLYDDIPYIVENQLLGDFRSIPKLLTSSYPPQSPAQGLYRPITALSFDIDYLFAGLNAAWFHGVNVVLHGAVSLMVFLMLRQITRREAPAAIAAALFAVHPAHTEAVSWIAGRSELLSAFFFLLAFYFHLRARLNRAGGRLLMEAASAASFAAALGSKEIAASFPLLLMAFYLAHRGDERWWAALRAAVRLAAPYFFVIACYLGLRYLSIGGIGPEPALQSLGHLSLWLRLATALKLYAYYLKLMLFPMPLNVDYNFPPASAAWEGAVILSLLILACVLLALLRARKDNPEMFFFSIWFFLALLPVVNIIPIGEIIAERFLYLPSVGFIAAMVAFFEVGIGARNNFIKKNVKNLFILSSIIMLMFFYLSFKRNGAWASEESLWSSTLRANPQSSIAHNNIGKTLLEGGFSDKAANEFALALFYRPDNAEAQDNLGVAYEKKGLWSKGESQYIKALELNPDDPRALNNLGNAYRRKGLLVEAERFYQKALRLNPANGAALNNLAMANKDRGFFNKAFHQLSLTSLNRVVPGEVFVNKGVLYNGLGYADRAILLYKKAASSLRADADLNFNLGMAYQSRNMDALAYKSFARAASIDPKMAAAYLKMGLLKEKKSDFEGAYTEYMAALGADPYDSNAMTNLGNIYLRRGMASKAIREYKAALTAKPDSALTHKNIGIVFLKLGVLRQAERHLAASLKLDPTQPEAKAIEKALKMGREQ